MVTKFKVTTASKDRKRSSKVAQVNANCDTTKSVWLMRSSTLNSPYISQNGWSTRYTALLSHQQYQDRLFNEKCYNSHSLTLQCSFFLDKITSRNLLTKNIDRVILAIFSRIKCKSTNNIIKFCLFFHNFDCINLYTDCIYLYISWCHRLLPRGSR